LELFIEYPLNDFSARGIARKLKISHATVLKYINNLLKLDLIKKKEQTLYPTFYANTENQKYKFYKRKGYSSSM
jgi:predicted transcriptional regulator